METKNQRFKNVCALLPHSLQSALNRLPHSIQTEVQEIVLRANRPLCVQTFLKRYYFTENFCITDTILNQQMLNVSVRMMYETFENICNYSIYSRQKEINNGYVTLRGGHRAGICGTAVVNDSKLVNIKDVTTINIRIAREIIGCSDELYRLVDPLAGVLICGAPCSGKTTLLRDYARRLSFDYKVSVIDERNELSSTLSGSSQNDIGMCDVYEGYIKKDAITHAVRSMSPDIIVCDEISTLEDIAALTHSVNCGVAFVASIHADDLEKMLKRTLIKEILSTGAFTQLVFLDSKQNAGKIESVKNISEIGGGLNF